jgi:predicted PurR-regulated permease PerM
MVDKDIRISVQTILIFLAILSGVWLLWLVKGVLLILFISVILALLLEPGAEWLRRRGVPNSVAAASVVLLLVLIFVSVASVAIFPIQQISRLLVTLPVYIETLMKSPMISGYQLQINNAIYGQLSQTVGGVISATLGAFSGLLNLVVILVFTVYLLMDFKNLKSMFTKLFPKEYQNDVVAVMSRIEVKLGGWLRGQLILMIIIGVATYIGLSFLGIDYALALAVIAGTLECVPTIGPIMSAIPAIIVAFVISPVAGFIVIGLYILIQQLENSFLVPKIMQKAVGFNPLVTIVVLLVGGKLLELVGAILAIPISIVIVEITRYFLYEKH